MKITFIGAGSAFTVGDNYQSNMLIQAPSGENMLLDCGSDARRALHELGFTHHDIGHAYISHLHSDHVGGLEWLGFSRYFDPSCDTPSIYINHDLLSDLWEHCLSAGMHSLDDIDASIHTYFKIHELNASQQPVFEFEGTDFHLIPTEHVYSNHQWVPCYGLLFQSNDKQVYITSDTRYTPDKLAQTYAKADIIFHDCETAPFKSGVHSHFSDLCQLPSEIKSKMWLYHYQPGELPDAKAEGFLGFVTPGQSFEP